MVQRRARRRGDLAGIPIYRSRGSGCGAMARLVLTKIREWLLTVMADSSAAAGDLTGRLGTWVCQPEVDEGLKEGLTGWSRALGTPTLAQRGAQAFSPGLPLAG